MWYGVYLRTLGNSKYWPPKTDLGRPPRGLYITRQICRNRNTAVWSCFLIFAISRLSCILYYFTQKNSASQISKQNIFYNTLKMSWIGLRTCQLFSQPPGARSFSCKSFPQGFFPAKSFPTGFFPARYFPRLFFPRLVFLLFFSCPPILSPSFINQTQSNQVKWN